ncbi:hypothetical protein GCM10023205_74190 [Yinghuangia aomiensis]|uniref:Uncharacterized protein n=1 Tax=Yinghuangia aomiensis TaxID=676205 RepID=A0ABP9IAF4_9ACTN
MGLFGRRRSRAGVGTVHDVTERAVEPLDVRFGSVLSASPEQRDAVIAEMALWEIPRPDLAEGEVQWVTCRGTWYPPDYRSIPVRFYMTDRRLLMYEAGPDDVFDSRLSTGHVDFWFDDVAVFDPQPTTQRRPNAVPYLIITSRTGRPADGKRCDVEFNLDEEGARFIGTAIKALREHGGVHARVSEGAAQEIDGSDPQQGPPAPQGPPASSSPSPTRTATPSPPDATPAATPSRRRPAAKPATARPRTRPTRPSARIPTETCATPCR